MSERTFPEQICAVLVLELGISKKESGRFLEFYNRRDYKFNFEDGLLKNGWFLKDNCVGEDPASRGKHKELIKKVNGLIWEILEVKFQKIKEAKLDQVA